MKIKEHLIKQVTNALQAEKNWLKITEHLEKQEIRVYIRRGGIKSIGWLKIRDEDRRKHPISEILTIEQIEQLQNHYSQHMQRERDTEAIRASYERTTKREGKGTWEQKIEMI